MRHRAGVRLCMRLALASTYRFDATTGENPKNGARPRPWLVAATPPDRDKLMSATSAHGSMSKLRAISRKRNRAGSSRESCLGYRRSLWGTHGAGIVLLSMTPKAAAPADSATERRDLPARSSARCARRRPRHPRATDSRRARPVRPRGELPLTPMPDGYG